MLNTVSSFPEILLQCGTVGVRGRFWEVFESGRWSGRPGPTRYEGVSVRRTTRTVDEGSSDHSPSASSRLRS